MSTQEIAIKRLLTAPEFNQVVELQKHYWGSDASNLVPRHVLHTLCHHGGHLLGAYAGERLVGFVLGIFGTDIDPEAPDAGRTAASLLIMSKRMLVLPAFRGRGIGLRLKLAQRDIALKQGIELVKWTVDPLLAANAHLNFRKLGAVACQYQRDYFGGFASQSMTGDRLVLHWRVNSERARACAAGQTSRRSLRQCLDEQTPIVNSVHESGPAPAPGVQPRRMDTDSVLVEFPADIRLLDEQKPQAAQRWRLHLREVLSGLLESGYVVCDFLSAADGGRRRVFYYLARRGCRD